MQIQIGWLLQKSADLDLHCLQRQGIFGFSKTRVKHLLFLYIALDKAFFQPKTIYIFLPLPHKVVVGTHKKCLTEVMRAYIKFQGETRKVVISIPLLSTAMVISCV